LFIFSFFFQKLEELETALRKEKKQSASSVRELDEQLELMNVMDRCKFLSWVYEIWMGVIGVFEYT